MTTTPKEFLAARSAFLEIHRDEMWNPWAREERAAELEQAMDVFDGWTRAEPGFKPMTLAQWRARERRHDKRWRAQLAHEDAEREKRRMSYDAARAEVRLWLLELEASVRNEEREEHELEDRTLFPGMDDTRRAKAIDECAQRTGELRTAIAGLREQVGDPEEVCDALGYQPAERRRHNRTYFSLARQRTGEALRVEVSEASATLAAATARKARADLRERARSAQHELDTWLAVLPIPDQDMCADCCRPSAWHERREGPRPEHTFPCPSWPRWAARIRQVREMLERAAETTARERAEPPAPKPTPVAVVESGLPIAEVIQRLQELQAHYPTAEVRRGRNNRWELWAPAEP